MTQATPQTLMAPSVLQLCMDQGAMYQPDRRFAVSTHFMWFGSKEARQELDWMAAAGMASVRFDLSWRRMEPTDDGFNEQYLQLLDDVLDMLDERQMARVITVLETPAWARQDKGSAMTPPVSPEEFGEALGYLAARNAHRPNMVYEIWNEPNDSTFWDITSTVGIDWTLRSDPAHYTRMLRAAYLAIKSADADATVLGGSIVFRDPEFLAGMYAAGAKGYFDGLAVHPYARYLAPDDPDPGSMSSQVVMWREMLAANGEPGKPIWITEVGWRDRALARTGRHPSDTERAGYYTRAVALVRSWPDVPLFTAYLLNKANSTKDNEIGLVAGDGTPTQSWLSYVCAVNGRPA